MLKAIDPALNADMLHALRSMGHGDRLVVADLNFPSDAIARDTVLGRPLRMENLTAARAVEAILTLMPLDAAAGPPVGRMEAAGAAEELPPVQRELQQVVDRAEGAAVPMRAIERFAFYEEARGAYAVVATGEARFFGCFVLVKGVVPPSGEGL